MVEGMCTRWLTAAWLVAALVACGGETAQQVESEPKADEAPPANKPEPAPQPEVEPDLPAHVGRTRGQDDPAPDDGVEVLVLQLGLCSQASWAEQQKKGLRQ